MAGGSQGVLYIAPKSFMSSKKKCSMPVANPCNRIEWNTGWDRDPWNFCRTCVALTGYKLGYCFKKNLVYYYRTKNKTTRTLMNPVISNAWVIWPSTKLHWKARFHPSLFLSSIFTTLDLLVTSSTSIFSAACTNIINIKLHQDLINYGFLFLRYYVGMNNTLVISPIVVPFWASLSGSSPSTRHKHS